MSGATSDNDMAPGPRAKVDPRKRGNPAGAREVAHLQLHDGRPFRDITIPAMREWPQVVLWRGAAFVYVAPNLEDGHPIYRHSSLHVATPSILEVSSAVG